MNYFNNTAEIEALVSRLIDKLDSSRTERLELDVGDVRIKLDRHSAPPMPMSPAIMPVAAPAPEILQEAAPTAPEAPAAPEGAVVKAPLLGVAYAAPSPDAAPFVKVGQKVKKGDIICIIEAMKVMNEIEADADGEVVRILFENGKMVEYGQPLVIIK